jgi:hypothetical protein
MITRILLILGISLLVYSLLLCYKTISILHKKNTAHGWLPVFFLIGLFLAGYVFYLVSLGTSTQADFTDRFLIPSILFFGSVFVVIVLKINGRLIENLEDDSKKLEDINRELSTKNSENINSKIELEKTKTNLEKKNKELLNTLEDFYMLRIGVERDIEKKTFHKENMKIKKKINALK